MWIARNKSGKIYAYRTKPLCNEERGCFLAIDENKLTYTALRLSKTDFPEITFENSPVEIKHFDIGRIEKVEMFDSTFGCTTPYDQEVCYKSDCVVANLCSKHSNKYKIETSVNTKMKE